MILLLNLFDIPFNLRSLVLCLQVNASLDDIMIYFVQESDPVNPYFQVMISFTFWSNNNIFCNRLTNHDIIYVQEVLFY